MGEIDPGRVLRYAAKSAKAGAVDLGNLAEHGDADLTNAHRAVVSALG